MVRNVILKKSSFVIVIAFPLSFGFWKKHSKLAKVPEDHPDLFAE